MSPKRVVLCHPGTFVFSVFAPSTDTARIGWLRLRWPFYFYFSGSSCPNKRLTWLWRGGGAVNLGGWPLQDAHVGPSMVVVK